VPSGSQTVPGAGTRDGLRAGRHTFRHAV